MSSFSAEQRQELDGRLSQRFIALDPAGYFLIKLDRAAGELIAEHYGNGIDDRGLATDPDTGEQITEMSPGLMQRLRPGESFQGYTPTRPNTARSVCTQVPPGCRSWRGPAPGRALALPSLTSRPLGPCLRHLGTCIRIPAPAFAPRRPRCPSFCPCPSRCWRGCW